MSITVKLHTSLQKKTSHGVQNFLVITLPDRATLFDLLTELNLIGRDQNLLMVVNHRVCDSTQVLHDSDSVDLIPVISGGD